MFYSSFHSLNQSINQSFLVRIQDDAQEGNNWDLLCNLLKLLLTIPGDNRLGRSMWHQITTAAYKVVTMSATDSEEEMISQSDLEELLTKKEVIEEMYRSIREGEDKQEAYRKQLHQLQDELDLARASQKMQSAGTPSAYHNQVISQLVAQTSEYMDVRYMRDDPVYSKYFLMLEKGKTLEEVVQLCKQDGVDDHVVRGCPIQLKIKPGINTSQQQPPAVPQDDPNDPRKNPEYDRWFKMLKVGIPKDAVKLKMQENGVDPSILDYEPPQTNNSSQPPAVPQDDPNDPRKNPEYDRWFKMLKVGIPKDAVKLKMQENGVDPSILDYKSPFETAQSATTAKAGGEEEYQPVPKKKEVKKEEPKEPEYNPPKAKREPAVKLKNIYWDPVVGEPLRGSVWERFHEEQVELDYAALHNAFPAKAGVMLSASASQLDANMKKPDEMVKLIKDDKRLRNVGMAVARLKMSFEALREDIIRVDDVVLNSDMLRMLRENIPTPEEVAIVKDYEGKVELLGDVDRFFKVLSTIPNLQLRVRNLQLRANLKEEIQDVRKEVGEFESLMKTFCNSVKLEQLLETILAIGNYMNGMYD